MSQAKRLEKGAVVTAEVVKGEVRFAAAGTIEPQGTAPEKVLFEIGSISKVFTGLLLAQAVVEKKVTLDTTLREVMGEKQKFAEPEVASITLGQLATHTSGLPRLPSLMIPAAAMPNPYAAFDRAMLDMAVADQKLEGKASYNLSYSNYGVGLLGDLLSRVYDKSWEQLV
jgi:D-alanyl-D-alanine-carboxypeptidase/D-alanyl-D-alanine-endopeptidase